MVDPVDEHPAIGVTQQHRQELQAGRDADGGPELPCRTVRTSQSWATRCIQVPVFETIAPVAHSR